MTPTMIFPAQNEGGQLNGGGCLASQRPLNLMRKISIRMFVSPLDGAYMDFAVYVNGQLVGHYPNGATTSYDITDYLNKDGRENVVAVHAINKQPSSRWYSGSGIYRCYSFKSQIRFILRKNGTTILNNSDLENNRMVC